MTRDEPTVLPGLRAAVLAAATRAAEAAPEIEADPATPARRRRPRGRSLGLLAFGVVLVAGTAAAAATGVWRPEIGDEHRPHPTISASPLPADQLAAFGVLRRPQTAADRGPRTRYALRFLDRRFTDGVRTDGVRLISNRGRGYVLIPVEHADLGGGEEPGTAKRDALCLFAIDTEGGGESCQSTEDARQGRLMTTMMPPPKMTRAERERMSRAIKRAMKRAHGHSVTIPAPPVASQEATFAGLVPDGVAEVRVGVGANEVRAPVHDNFFVAVVRGLPHDTITWWDAAGQRLAKGP